MKNNSPCYKNGEINISPSMLMKILADARIGIVSLMFIDKGWDFEVYLLNGNTIVRVPRKPAVVARLRDEICILELIRDNPWACVPNYQMVIEGNQNRPPVAGYPMLEGAPYDILADDKGVTVDIVKFTSWLHRIHIQHRIALSNTTNLNEYKEEAKTAYLSIRSELEPHICSTFDEYFSWTIPHCDAKVVIHNDLRTDHILVNSSQVAIIDWTDIAWAYPWEEFLWWWLYWGDEIFHVLANHYDGWREEWIDCIRFVGTWKVVLEYYYGLQTHDEHKLLVARQALRNNYLSND